MVSVPARWSGQPRRHARRHPGMLAHGSGTRTLAGVLTACAAFERC
ncbi:hypothetical protein [Arthrobacter dokdonensis]|nr:hypothetical protein [Arthrobacter dokdonellae]